MAQHALWAAEYGHTFSYKTLPSMNRFYTEDPVALNYILSHGDIFQKPSRTRRGLSDLLGNGLLTAEGADHKRQRKLLNSSFSPSAVRDMVPIFYDKAYELRDKILGLVENEQEGEVVSPTEAVEMDQVVGAKKIDVMKYLAQATLDVIGVAGFDYDFKALSEKDNVLAGAYRDMFSVGMSLTPMAIFQALVPGARYIVSGRAGQCGPD